MLRVTIPAVDYWDGKNEQFVTIKEQTLQLEHSLVSLSKWESKWCKPFLSNREKTTEEIIDYIKCMTLTQNVHPLVYNNLSKSNIDDVSAYIESPMTATKFYDDGTGKKNNDVITSELIYYWMLQLNIPFECQKWHLNRLLTLIRVCSEKNSPPKKMSKAEIMARNRALNESRRQQLNSKG